MKKTDLHSRYHRWDEHYVEYNEQGKKITSSGQKYLNASKGRSCFEILSYYEEYYYNGQLKYYQKDLCDCRKSIRKEYNVHGELLYKHVSHMRDSI